MELGVIIDIFLDYSYFFLKTTPFLTSVIYWLFGRLVA